MKIKITRLFDGARVPERTQAGDYALDLFAWINRNELIRHGECRIIPCGVAVEMPEGYGLFIIPRSGLAVKHGITVYNSPGLIDSNYRGEIRVIVHNGMRETFQIFPEARIAQCVVLPLMHVDWDVAEVLPENRRASAYA